MSHNSLLLKHFAGLLGLLLLNACAVGPDFKQPVSPVASNFSLAKQTGIQQQAIEQQWWRHFKDPQLDQLIGQMLRDNFDLAAASLKLQEARLLRNNSQMNLLPSITSNSGYSKRQRSVAQFGGPTPFSRKTEFFNIGFDATWELDLFGRIQRTIEVQNAEVAIIEAERRDLQISLIAEVARNYIDLRGAQSRLAVALKNAENQRASYKMTSTRLAFGRGTKLDTARASEQLNSTLASIPLLENDIRHTMHRIAILTGQAPDALLRSLSQVKALPTIPATINIGKPDELLRRRADIRAAEQAIASATAAVGVTVADLFPRVKFIGNIGLESRSLLGLGAGGSDSYSFGPAIRWAAFDIIRIRQRIKAADAEAAAQVAHYHSTVLSALEETENALSSYGQQQQRLQFLVQASQASQEAAQLAHLRYEAGVSDFLTVLDAERRLLTSQDQLAEGETQVCASFIALYKALGGGWEDSKQTDKVSGKQAG